MSMEVEQYQRKFQPTFNNEIVEGSFEVTDEWIGYNGLGWEALLRAMRDAAYNQALTFFIYYDYMRHTTTVKWVPAAHPYHVGVWKQAIR